MIRTGFRPSALAICAAGCLFTTAAVAGPATPFFEKNTNRVGADYSIFDISSGGANACYKACAKDKQCLSWTWHRPGTKGRSSKGKSGTCHLKSKIAHSQKSPCCISGVLVGTQPYKIRKASSSSVLMPTGSQDQRLDANGLFRKASLPPGTDLDLPDFGVTATLPPMKITPLTYTSSDEF